MSRIDRRLYSWLFIVGLALSAFSISGFVSWLDVMRSWDGNTWTANFYAFKAGQIIHIYPVGNVTASSLGSTYSLVDARWSAWPLIVPVLSLYAIPMSLMIGLALIVLQKRLTTTHRMIILLVLAAVPFWILNDLDNFKTFLQLTWGIPITAKITFGVGSIINLASSIIFFAQVLIDRLVSVRPEGEKELKEATTQKT